MIFKELCPTQSRHTRSLSQPLADARQAVNLKPIALTRTEPDMHPYLPNVGTMQPLAGYCSSRLPPSSSVLGRDPSQLLRCADCQASGLLEPIAIFYQLGSSGLFLQRASSNSKAQVGLLLLVQGLFDPVAGVECLGLAAIWAAPTFCECKKRQCGVSDNPRRIAKAVLQYRLDTGPKLLLLFKAAAGWMSLAPNCISGTKPSL